MRRVFIVVFLSTVILIFCGDPVPISEDPIIERIIEEPVKEIVIEILDEPEPIEDLIIFAIEPLEVNGGPLPDDLLEDPEESHKKYVVYGYGSVDDYQNYAYAQFANYEWGEYDFTCLVKLWNRESRWNPEAHNKSSGAHGIPQALPASKMATHGDDYWDNPYTQIRWGLDYISRRYGSPAKAWAHSQSHGWY